jgi:glutamate dehydrogenase (NAD(P)+)
MDMTIKNEVDEVTPESTYSFYDDNRFLGYLIIDSSINGISGGGVRIVPEISKFELSHLARAMTLKYSFLKLPFGGAKAAIIADREIMSEAERRECIRLFAKNLVPLRRKYLPGRDIGLDEEDHRLMLRNGGFKEYRSRPDSAFYTALTVLISAEESAKERQISLTDCTIAIEGFGKVGSWVARQFSEVGCRIIAVSTVKGAIYNPKGLDVAELLKLRNKFGDNFVHKCENTRKIRKEDLLLLPTDFLIPCAFSWSINLSNVRDIQARLIVCGANNPVTDKAKQVLLNNNVLYFPDFVSNCGGVFGSIMETLCSEGKTTAGFVGKAFRSKVRNLFTLSEIKHRSLDQIAKEIAMANFRKMKEKEDTPINRFFALALGLFRQGLVPRGLVRMFGPIYLRMTLDL